MIRSMQADDLEYVVSIEQQVQTHPWRLTQFQQSLDHYACTVWVHHDQVVGFCILQCVLDEANLLLMAIDPQYQGQGFGAQLLSQSIAQLNNQPVQIFLEVRESNAAAIRLYEKLDFHQIDLRKNYYPSVSGGREHAVIMVKSCHDSFEHMFSTTMK